ncbi:MAG: sulfur carrier protein ThiS [Cyanobium sp.]
MSAPPASPRGEAPPITIRLNGEERRVAAGLSLQALLPALGYQPRLVVVEFNGAILPRDRWAAQPVVESDALEVVTIVGGGS